MVQQQFDMDIDERDREVLTVLAEGRANPKYIRDETGIEKGELNTILVRLGRSGLTRQVTRGLYEITDDGRSEIGAETASVDVDELQRALDDVEAACERGDSAALESALHRAREAIDDA